MTNIDAYATDIIAMIRDRFRPGDDAFAVIDAAIDDYIDDPDFRPAHRDALRVLIILRLA